MKISRRYTLIAIVSTVLVGGALNRLYDYLYDSDALSAGDPSFVSDTTRARIWFEEGARMYERSQYDSSLTFVAKAAAIYKKDSLWDFYVESMNYVADDLRRLGQYDTSYSLLQTNIATGMRRLGEMNANTAMAINKLGLWYRDKGEYEKALDCYDRALKIRLTVLPSEHIEIGWSYVNIGLVNLSLGNFNASLIQYEKAQRIFIKNLGEKSWPLALLYGNMGSVFNITGHYDKALEYFNKSLNMRVELFGPEKVSVGLMYNSLATVYLKLSDYPKALTYLNRSLSILLKQLGEVNLETANSIYNLGFAYRGTGNHPEALRMFQKALHLRLQIFGPMHHYVASAYDEIGLEWMEQNENDSAIVYFQKALKVHTAKPGTKSFMRAYEYRHIGSAYLNKKEYNLALEYCNKALEINLKYYGKKHEQVSQSYSDIANIYLRKSDFAKAVENSLLSIDALIWGKSLAISQLQTLNAPMLFSAFEALGDIHFQKFEKLTQAPYDLREAFASYQTAINLTDKIRRDYTLEESKLMLGQKMNGVVEKAIRTAIQLFETTNDSSFLQAAFIFSERNKASVLSEALNDQYAKSTTGIPDSIIQYESQLQARVGSLNKKLYSEQTAVSPANKKIRTLQDQIFNLSTEYERHIQYIERRFPHYFELKYKPITISLKDIQKILPDSTALIEFFIGNQLGFVFYLDKNRFFYHTLVADSTVFRNIAMLRSGMESQNFESYSTSASLLYRTFIAPLTISNIANLIIIPDGPLASIPFEVLLTKPAKTQEYSDLDYLIKTYTISYAYSSALSFQKNASQENPRKNLVGFSPSFFK